MTPLRGIVRDLVERRLWPLAALLVLGLVAVPVLLLRPAPAALEQTAAPVASAAPAAPAAAGATPAAAPASADAALADPSVALTSSPFAAAFGSGLNLPPAMEGLLKSTKGADVSKTVADAPLHDPFATAASAASAAPSPSPAPAAAGSSPSGSTGASGGGTASAATSAPVAAPEAAPAPAPKPAAAPTPAPAPGQPADDSSKTLFHADVRFGTTETPPMVRDARRLTAFPSSYDPLVVYLGVMRGGWGAAFALKDGAQPLGAASCRPRKQICTWVILHPGEAVTLSVKDPVTGAVTPYQLKLERIRSTTVTPDAALTANSRVSKAGRCLLGPLAAYRYDTASGTLAPRPELKSCRYRAPGQAEAASVRVAHLG